MVRPLTQIDWKKVDELLISGCDGTDIAGYFGIHPDTFYKHVEREKKMGFTAYLQQKRSKGDSILKAHQYAKALGLTDKGDNTLLVWLGKTRLKQVDSSQENANRTQVNVHVNGKLASGLNVRAEGLSGSDNPSAESGD